MIFKNFNGVEFDGRQVRVELVGKDSGGGDEGGSERKNHSAVLVENVISKTVRVVTANAHDINVGTRDCVSMYFIKTPIIASLQWI